MKQSFIKNNTFKQSFWNNKRAFHSWPNQGFKYLDIQKGKKYFLIFGHYNEEMDKFKTESIDIAASNVLHQWCFISVEENTMFPKTTCWTTVHLWRGVRRYSWIEDCPEIVSVSCSGGEEESEGCRAELRCGGSAWPIGVIKTLPDMNVNKDVMSKNYYSNKMEHLNIEQHG